MYLLWRHPDYTIGDIDGDGTLDYLITSIPNEMLILAMVASIVTGILGVLYFIILRRVWLVEDPLHIPGWELFTVAGDLARSTNEAKLMKKTVRRANETMASTLEDMFFLLVFPEHEE